MSLDQDKVTKIVIEALKDAWSEYDLNDTPTVDSDIFGGQSVLDSTGLVSMILDLEERLEEEIGVTVSLMDEKAVSQKNSPFQSVSTMVEFILTVAEEG